MDPKKEASSSSSEDEDDEDYDTASVSSEEEEVKVKERRREAQPGINLNGGCGGWTLSEMVTAIQCEPEGECGTRDRLKAMMPDQLVIYINFLELRRNHPGTSAVMRDAMSNILLLAKEVLRMKRTEILNDPRAIQKEAKLLGLTKCMTEAEEEERIEREKQMEKAAVSHVITCVRRHCQQLAEKEFEKAEDEARRRYLSNIKVRQAEAESLSKTYAIAFFFLLMLAIIFFCIQFPDFLFTGLGSLFFILSLGIAILGARRANIAKAKPQLLKGLDPAAERRRQEAIKRRSDDLISKWHNEQQRRKKAEADQRRRDKAEIQQAKRIEEADRNDTSRRLSKEKRLAAARQIRQKDHRNRARRNPPLSSKVAPTTPTLPEVSPDILDHNEDISPPGVGGHQEEAIEPNLAKKSSPYHDEEDEAEAHDLGKEDQDFYQHATAVPALTHLPFVGSFRKEEDDSRRPPNNNHDLETGSQNINQESAFLSAFGTVSSGSAYNLDQADFVAHRSPFG